MNLGFWLITLSRSSYAPSYFSHGLQIIIPSPAVCKQTVQAECSIFVQSFSFLPRKTDCWCASFHIYKAKNCNVAVGGPRKKLLNCCLKQMIQHWSFNVLIHVHIPVVRETIFHMHWFCLLIPKSWFVVMYAFPQSLVRVLAESSRQ